MWPNWTSGRMLKTLRLQVLVEQRTAGQRNGAIHSDGGSTAPQRGPKLDQDLEGLQRPFGILLFPANSVEPDLEHTGHPTSDVN